ncbi:MAG: F0F1 ATP synthase subunit B [Fimbriimonas sp.]|nr:F0F1 ATP synthase subunit B [Fimbriimonas sp.]
MAEHTQSKGIPAIVKIVGGLVIAVLGVVANNANLTVHQPITIEFGKTIGSIGVFIALFPVIESFFVKPLTAAIDERNTNLETTFSEVETLRNEMTTMKGDYEKRIASTEAEAREKINAQIKEAQSLRQSLMAEAAAKSDALVKQAQEEIASEKAKVLGELRTHVTDLSLTAAEKVVGANMDTAANRKLIADFIADLEVKA